MLMHIVMWKLKEKNKQENLDKMQMMLASLKDEIPALRHAEIGQDVKTTDGNFDIVLVSEFESAKDLAAYQAHEAHVRAGEFIGQVREKRVCVDYQI